MTESIVMWLSIGALSVPWVVIGIKKLGEKMGWDSWEEWALGLLGLCLVALVVSLFVGIVTHDFHNEYNAWTKLTGNTNLTFAEWNSLRSQRLLPGQARE